MVRLAYNNLDEYRYYYKTADWMKASEKNAQGCGAWYYRCSVALMYCGRLDEAHRYAEEGTRQEPDYPWIWLQAGKLRAHFGDPEGALRAVARGLELVPGDYEFQTLEREIRSGCTLEQMEYHWIDPGADQTLQAGQDPDQQEKQRSIQCIRVDEAGLEAFRRIFTPERYRYTKDDPYCVLHYPVQGHPVKLVFGMNEAGLSKLGAEFLSQLKAHLDALPLTYTPDQEPEGTLFAVMVQQDRPVSLWYQQPGEEEPFALPWEPGPSEPPARTSYRKG